MDRAWLYTHLGTLAQVALFAALILIGIFAIRRKQKGKRLSKNSGRVDDGS